MKILDIERNTLLKPLQTVSGIVERRHTLPILSNVLLETDAKELKLVATDLEIQVATQASLDKEASQQRITVSARKLQDEIVAEIAAELHGYDRQADDK